MRRQAVFFVLLALFMGLTVWITGMGKIGIYDAFTWDKVLGHAKTHLEMVLIAEAIAIAIGVPMGILITRPGFTRLATPVIGGANMGQSIPSMAVIAIMAVLPIGFLGFNQESAIAALTIYGLLPILRNSYAAISNINPAIIEAARGMGMTRLQIALKVELPLAIPVIVTGIRVSTVIIVGTAELAALIGAGGLGTITLTGVFAREPLLIVQGAAPTAAMAIILGYIIERMENWRTPRGLKVAAEIV